MTPPLFNKKILLLKIQLEPKFNTTYFDFVVLLFLIYTKDFTTYAESFLIKYIQKVNHFIKCHTINPSFCNPQHLYMAWMLMCNFKSWFELNIRSKDFLIFRGNLPHETLAGSSEELRTSPIIPGTPEVWYQVRVSWQIRNTQML